VKSWGSAYRSYRRPAAQCGRTRFIADRARAHNKTVQSMLCTAAAVLFTIALHKEGRSHSLRAALARINTSAPQKNHLLRHIRSARRSHMRHRAGQSAATYRKQPPHNQHTAARPLRQFLCGCPPERRTPSSTAEPPHGDPTTFSAQKFYRNKQPGGQNPPFSRSYTIVTIFSPYVKTSLPKANIKLRVNSGVKSAKSQQNQKVPRISLDADA